MQPLAGAMTTSIYLEKRIPARNQKRFYTITVTPTLFGSWTLMREWGPDRTAGHGAGTGFATEGEA